MISLIGFLDIPSFFHHIIIYYKRLGHKFLRTHLRHFLFMLFMQESVFSDLTLSEPLANLATLCQYIDKPLFDHLSESKVFVNTKIESLKDVYNNIISSMYGHSYRCTV